MLIFGSVITTIRVCLASIWPCRYFRGGNQYCLEAWVGLFRQMCETCGWKRKKKAARHICFCDYEGSEIGG